jgi:hypothetical protein
MAFGNLEGAPAYRLQAEATTVSAQLNEPTVSETITLLPRVETLESINLLWIISSTEPILGRAS